MNIVVRIVFFVVALALSAAVAAASLQFYGSVAEMWSTSWYIYAAFVLSSFTVKMGVPYALRFFPEMRALLVTCICFCAAFDFIGVSGFSTMTRGATIETKAGDAKEYGKTEAQIEKAKKDAAAEASAAALKLGELKAETAKYADVRATEIINAELKAAQTKAPRNGCNRNNAHFDTCKDLAAAELEEANAKARDNAAGAFHAFEIQAAADRAEARRSLKALEAKLAGMERPNQSAANPLAAGLAKPVEYWLPGWGEFFADLIIRTLFVVVGEIVPTALAYAALKGGRAPREFEARDAPAGDSKGDPPEHVPKRPPRNRAPPEDLLGALRAIRNGTLTRAGLAVSGNGIVITSRALAPVVGVSASKVHAGLKSLADAGKLTLRPGSGGTYVELKESA